MSQEVAAEELDLGRVGRCIYCDATDDLRDEHPIPFGLGGRAKLYDSTCGRCADITSAFEGHVLRSQLGAFRTVLRLPTRRPRSRPASFRARLRRGGSWAYEDVPLERYTAAGAFPRLPVPGVAEGRPEGGPIRMTGAVGVTVIRTEGERNPAARAGADAIEMNVPIALVAFMRLLAKVALGYSVAFFGADRLDPAIRGVVLGTDADINRWVGCPPPEWAVFGSPAAAHNVRVANIYGFVVAWVRMFATAGAPEYMVIVGRLRPAAD